jgi:hypothetical protein
VSIEIPGVVSIISETFSSALTTEGKMIKETITANAEIARIFTRSI